MVLEKEVFDSHFRSAISSYDMGKVTSLLCWSGTNKPICPINLPHSPVVPITYISIGAGREVGWCGDKECPF